LYNNLKKFFCLKTRTLEQDRATPGADRLLFVCRVPSEGWVFAGKPEVDGAPAEVKEAPNSHEALTFRAPSTGGSCHEFPAMLRHLLWRLRLPVPNESKLRIIGEEAAQLWRGNTGDRLGSSALVINGILTGLEIVPVPADKLPPVIVPTALILPIESKNMPGSYVMRLLKPAALRLSWRQKRIAISCRVEGRCWAEAIC